MKKYNLFLLLILFLIVLNACTKEGKGGSATIEGKVMINLKKQISFDKDTIITTYEAKDEKVYIIYGDNSSFDDATKTSYNGNYKFDYLYKGNYTIYAYSECIFDIDDCPSKSKTVIEKVVINSKNGTTTVPIIYLNKYF